MLYRIGYRQFFPGPRWEVVPQLRDILSTSTRTSTRITSPAASGTARACGISRRNPTPDWCAKNRARSGIVLNSGHSYDGIIARNKAVFAEHPEYLALVGGKRQGPKFCISNPGLRQLVVAQRLAAVRETPRAGQHLARPQRRRRLVRVPECAKLGSVSDRALNARERGGRGRECRGIRARSWACTPTTIIRRRRTIAVDPHVVISVATAFIKGGATARRTARGLAQKGATPGHPRILRVNPWDRDMPGKRAARNLAYLSAPSLISRARARVSVGRVERQLGTQRPGLLHRLAAALGHPGSLAVATSLRIFSPGRSARRRSRCANSIASSTARAAPGAKRSTRAHVSGADEARTLAAAAGGARPDRRPILYARYAELYRAYAQPEGPARQAAFEALIRHAFRMRETLLVHTKALYRDLAARDTAVSVPPRRRAGRKADGKHLEADRTLLPRRNGSSFSPKESSAIP